MRELRDRCAQPASGSCRWCNSDEHNAHAAWRGGATAELQNRPGPTLTCVNRRAWLVGGMCVLLVAAGVVAYARTRDSCGDAVTSLPAAKSSSPFLDAEQRAQQPDENRDALVDTLAGDPAPIGEVLGAVGYHYEQWAQVSSYAQGIGVRTRDNPDFTMLDNETLKPRWSVQVDTKRSAYDASDERYLVATMPAKTAPDLVALDADNGHRRWCAHLGGDVVHAADPFATQFPHHQRVAVLGPVSGAVVVRLSGRMPTSAAGARGRCRWGRLPGRPRRQHPVGGRPAAVRAVRPCRDGSPQGRHGARAARRQGRLHRVEAERAGPGPDVHVVGTDPDSGTAVLQEWDGATRTAKLTAIDRDGKEVWSVVPSPGKAFYAALRTGRGAAARAGEQPASANDLADGHLLWRRSVPARPQFLPQRFRARQRPSARRGPRAHRGYDGAAHARPGHRRDDLGRRCRPTGSTRPTGPTSPRSPTG